MRPSSAPQALMGQLFIFLWEVKQINGYSSCFSERKIKMLLAVFLWKTLLHQPFPQTRLIGRRDLGDLSPIWGQVPQPLPGALDTPSPTALHQLRTLSQSRSRRLSLFLQGISTAGCSAVGGTLRHGCCCFESQPAASLCTQTLHSVVHSRATPEGLSLQVASALLLITLSDAPKICAEHTKAPITFLMLSACLAQGTHSKITLQEGVV